MALLIARYRGTDSVQNDLENALAELESISDDEARRLLLELKRG
jgi:hypothetical protein